MCPCSVGGSRDLFSWCASLRRVVRAGTIGLVCSFGRVVLRKQQTGHSCCSVKKLVFFRRARLAPRTSARPLGLCSCTAFQEPVVCLVWLWALGNPITPAPTPEAPSTLRLVMYSVNPIDNPRKLCRVIISSRHGYGPGNAYKGGDSLALEFVFSPPTRSPALPSPCASLMASGLHQFPADRAHGGLDQQRLRKVALLHHPRVAGVSARGARPKRPEGDQCTWSSSGSFKAWLLCIAPLWLSCATDLGLRNSGCCTTRARFP